MDPIDPDEIIDENSVPPVPEGSLDESTLDISEDAAAGPEKTFDQLLTVPPPETPRIPLTLNATRALAAGWISRAPQYSGRITLTTQAWIATGVITLLALVMRLWHLGALDYLIFDETYYVKDAYSLGTLGYEAKWPDEINDAFAAGDFSSLSTKPSFVVHPQLGKWLIWLGMWLLGPENPTGWRLSAAIAGTLCIFLVCRIAWLLFRSVTVTIMAGAFLTFDGLNLVLSRTGLLDVFLAAFILAAFWAVLQDQIRSRPVLINRLLTWNDTDILSKHLILGPGNGFRPWLIFAGILLGCACAVKWSGIYAIAVLGLFVVFRACSARYLLGMRTWFWAGAIKDGIPAFFALVLTALLTYLVTWFSWFTQVKSWGHGKSGISGIWGRFADLWIYHVDVWDFHRSVTSHHTYQSQPITWLVQARPTSFAWREAPAAFDCPTDRCVSAVLALGNPVLWWFGVIAFAIAIYWAISQRDWRIWFVLCGYLATWVPWLPVIHRTVFDFYMVVLSPFVALAVAVLVGVSLGKIIPIKEPLIASLARFWPPKVPNRNLGTLQGANVGSVCAIILLTIAAGIFFFPIWTGEPIPFHHWQWRMWLPFWV